METLQKHIKALEENKGIVDNIRSMHLTPSLYNSVNVSMTIKQMYAILDKYEVLLSDYKIAVAENEELKSHSAKETKKLDFHHVMSKYVRPFLSTRSGLAPYSRRYFIMLIPWHNAVAINTDIPLLFCKLMSAPCSTRYFITS